MGAKTKIEWTDSSWNTLRGCSRVSFGCMNCYAETLAARFAGPGMPYEGLARNTSAGPRWTGKVMLVHEHLADPLRWTRPRRIFVNSMSDVFHPEVPDEYIAAMFGVMMYAKHHTFQVLTKRPERMAALLPTLSALRCHAAASGLIGDTSAWHRAYKPADAVFPLPNVWLGVSVEHQEAADERIPILLDTPAAVRFLSCEPLLGPVDLRLGGTRHGGTTFNVLDAAAGLVPWTDKPRLHWVIVGGESGTHARPMHPDWPRSIRDQCVAAVVPYFFKQWGTWIETQPVSSGDLGGDIQRDNVRIVKQVGESDGQLRHGDVLMRRIGKKHTGRDLDDRTWDEIPPQAETCAVISDSAL
ncbi:MAG: DUF5131 family protein [Gemmatimonadaceae bacterium]